MKTISEIFATNQRLLNEPEVKELIEQFQYQYNKKRGEYVKKIGDIHDIAIHSDFFLINGKNSKDCIREILDII